MTREEAMKELERIRDLYIDSESITDGQYGGTEICALSIALDVLSEDSKIVRCKDCKYWLSANGYCEILETWLNATEFCSHGERREEIGKN